MSEQLANGSGLFDYAWNGTDSIVSYALSAEAGWHYVSVMPKDRFMQRVESMKRIALFVLIVALACGGRRLTGSLTAIIVPSKNGRRPYPRQAGAEAAGE